MLTRGNLEQDEISLLRKQFEGYVKSHYDVQEISATYELQISKNASKMQEKLEKLDQL